ncbi:anthocyanidin reductase ((2S)-flavan-3-ol-forming)-like [Argentina anserina]|uniref:anthocyanidin reductase ((2S)-flavan-3-ol-forming)-like n=1 Tax=Argentina anserina TaxID=57926 RepID=UPI0021768739|nr:anthocyanidin reductase ((2S)-flavan-3-ol-forming)-like [Potentilla anserina]
MVKKVSRVCVTGGSGYIGCMLVKKLLEKGHSQKLRFLSDASKVGLLKSLPNADTNLLLFRADIYDPNEFEPAIEGCEFVFHVATPLQHNPQSSQYKDTTEAAVAGVRIIAYSCIRSQTVKRLIYTGSTLSMSSRKDDGVGFKPILDESCWTPLDASSTYGNAYTMGYIKSKTLGEKVMLSYNDFGDSKLEVVTLPCGLVGGESLLPNLVSSVGVILAQLTGDLFSCNALKFMQEFMGSIPLVHVDDVCQAHIFCMEQPSMKGRFCCAVARHPIKEIAMYFHETYPEYKLHKESTEGPKEGSKSDFSKLKKIGFQYKFGMKEILDDSVAWAKKLNVISFSQAV